MYFFIECILDETFAKFMFSNLETLADKKGSICCRDSSIYFGAFFAVKNANQWPQMYNSVHAQLAESAAAAMHYAQYPKILTKNCDPFRHSQ